MIRRVALAALATVGVIAAVGAVVGVVASTAVVTLANVPTLLLFISAACLVALWILLLPKVLP